MLLMRTVCIECSCERPEYNCWECKEDVCLAHVAKHTIRHWEEERQDPSTIYSSEGEEE
jgi:hypothetical protein